METREKLLEGALRVLVEQGVAKASARAVATRAGVNQALVFYHFGTVDELLAAACRHGAELRVARHRERMRSLGSLSELLAFGRELHAEEREAGHVAFLGQLLAGAQAHPRMVPATVAGLDLWIAEIEQVLVRVLAGTPLAEFTDPAGLSRAVAASFVGLELYEGVDPSGAEAAFAALEQLGALMAAVEELNPVARKAVTYTLRRQSARTR
ncbi:MULTISPECIES: TetR/AcrR family transcriptional regulator [unclassified Streptomyces]|uniref:TetR/AcrR family transcriptional regulator n=1 Tax=unclassified Streptomyces TaxID=2593676 RepID=UPI0006F44774|nr:MULTISPECIES: TetR/AcrR family transcriptional regulator [unclassified Streptomyces]KQX47557.1 TetR family transcriptional regulator [Streptomyces sp. Root1304]KRA94837.1 TetR family transcriptional regulator [Streptomyces sp. Root66D1]